MRLRALSFSKVPFGHAAPSGSYIHGQISLGDLNETFWSSTNIWSADDYELQWAAAAKLCLRRRQPVLFYTDVTAKASKAYHVVLRARELLIFQQVFRGPHRPVSRPIVARETVRERNDVSCWMASVASLREVAIGS